MRWCLALLRTTNSPVLPCSFPCLNALAPRSLSRLTASIVVFCRWVCEGELFAFFVGICLPRCLVAAEITVCQLLISVFICVFMFVF